MASVRFGAVEETTYLLETKGTFKEFDDFLSSDANPNRNEDARPSTPAAATFNLVNSILGAALVGLPFAMAQAGVLSGWILFVFTTFVTCYTFEVLTQVGDAACRAGKIASVAYESVAEYTLGKAGSNAVLAFQFLYTFGCCVGCIVILKDAMCPALLKLTGFAVFHQSTLVTFVICICALLPICLLRSVDSLSDLSLVSFLAVVGIVVLVSFEWLVSKDELCSLPGANCKPEYDVPIRSHFFDALNVFVLAMMAHPQIFPVYRSLGYAGDPEVFARITRTSVIAVAVMTGIATAAAYDTYGQSVEADFFTNYPTDSISINAGRVFFAMTMILSYPLQFVVAREVIQVAVLALTEPREIDLSGLDLEGVEMIAETGLAYSSLERTPEVSTLQPSYRRATGMAGSRVTFRRGKSGVVPLAQHASMLDMPAPNRLMSCAGGAVRSQTSNALHLGVSFPLFAVTVAIGLSGIDLGSAFSLNGGISGSALAFILPCAIGIRHAQFEKTTPFGGHVFIWSMMIFGFFMLALTIILPFTS